MKTVIICGGVGSKMWPMSRNAMPKHFLPLINGKSLFQLNYEALRKKFGPEEIFLQTNEVQAKIAKNLIPEIIDENIFVEPEMRNQGPATGFAAAQLIKRGFGDEPFILVQADVLREPDEKFLDMIGEQEKLGRINDKYITGGFVPQSIVRGVDYLVKGNLVSEESGVRIFEVADYIDRTEEEKIKQYLGTDKLLLHANHTSMTPNNLLKMYQKYKPEWYEPLVAIANNGDVVSEYGKMPKAGIEEVTKLVYKNGEALVVELPFNWVDFGTWESVANYMKEKGTYQPEDVLELDSNQNFVYRKDKKYVALIGVENLVVVDTGDALLIMKKENSGRVGEVVDTLKAENRNELV
ncbi:MAG: sugar phosphate nucleotidyltransferase [Candidatus Shapirobacteria bacterium]|nr:sugar phosphate nucleotidyltransferase [Candidatus Shapirobacteria bacterium]MDD3003165.1 sugar phosphate nucleotidyltransferase [Candidatus Shapirobacteria bacterium]MDD4382818.1 sugar phosphate nucleotidyltransferase [Candidatus Shapirobacteria bacterium]